MNKASLSDLRILENHNPDCESGYWFVSKTKNSWAAKVFGVRVGPTTKTASESARNIVCWLKDIYGEDWVDFFRFRNEKAAYPLKIGKKWQMVVYWYGVKTIKKLKFKDRLECITWFKNWKKQSSVSARQKCLYDAKQYLIFMQIENQNRLYERGRDKWLFYLA